MAEGLGYFTFVLHSHLPYVIGHGRWPHGMDWLNEAAAESYIPLLKAFRSLAGEGRLSGVTLGVTPILVEMLAAPAFRGTQQVGPPPEIYLTFHGMVRARPKSQVLTTWYSFSILFLARLKPGVSLAQARAEASAIAQRILRDNAQSVFEVGFNLVPLRQQLVGEIEIESTEGIREMGDRIREKLGRGVGLVAVVVVIPPVSMAPTPDPRAPRAIPSSSGHRRCARRARHCPTGLHRPRRPGHERPAPLARRARDAGCAGRGRGVGLTR